jgi:hypothetical protein
MSHGDSIGAAAETADSHSIVRLLDAGSRHDRLQYIFHLRIILNQISQQAVESQPFMSEAATSPVLTCIPGTNADLFPIALGMYVKLGAKIADVTYGKGVFWRNVNIASYNLHPSDIQTGVDFRHLPYADASFEAVVFDPPYMNGGPMSKTVSTSATKTKVT